jgi:octaprenyl-diphosphate synthase
LRQYGLAVGTAYQVYDDCLDLFGSEAAAGKSLGTDVAKGKLTLPLLLALERCSASERASIEAMVRDWEPRRFSTLLRIVQEYCGLKDSQGAVHQYLRGAREKLATLPDTPSRAALAGLADYLAQQTDALGFAD